MPIRPENRTRYPAEWPAISTQLKEAADWKCQGSPRFPQCRARHGSAHPVTGSKVVLTVGHLDHTPENCERTNLRVWCQRCHLNYDAQHHAQTAYATRKAAAGTADLFEPWEVHAPS